MDLLEVLQSINNVLWGPPLMILLGGFGVISTIYLGFPQFRHFKRGWSNSFGKLFSKEKQKGEKEGDGSLSSFQSLATAIAAQVGTGNLAGVATAIMSGGPGAILWMWIMAIIGMSTISVEASLAQKYRIRRDGELVGGPAYYISGGLKEHGMEGLGKFLAGFFAVTIILALGFIGNMVQSNSMATVVSKSFGIPQIAIGIGIAVFAALIFIGGVERIGRFAELVVPFMALIYVIGAIVILFKFNDQIIPVFKAIFTSSFTGEAVLGGAMGYTMKQAVRYGIARGLFSNEAGMGSTPNSHAVANVDHPFEQSTVAMIGVFIDTIIVCTATALVILLTGAENAGLEAALVTQHGFETAFPGFGGKFLAIALLFFAFTTVIGWYYFGEANIKYLFKSKTAVRIYQILVIAFIIVGSTREVAVVWEMADVFNGIMVIPNIIGLFILLKEAKAIKDDYETQLASGKPLYYDYRAR